MWNSWSNMSDPLENSQLSTLKQRNSCPSPLSGHDQKRVKGSCSNAIPSPCARFSSLGINSLWWSVSKTTTKLSRISWDICHVSVVIREAGSLARNGLDLTCSWIAGHELLELSSSLQWLFSVKSKTCFGSLESLRHLHSQGLSDSHSLGRVEVSHYFQPATQSCVWIWGQNVFHIQLQ